jgi:hypothetical protein
MTSYADLERDGPSWPFAVQSGDDALRQLHIWLESLEASGTIGSWFGVGSRTDQSGTVALIEFENDQDGVRACSAWQRAKQLA